MVPLRTCLTHRKQEATLNVGGDLGFRLTGLRVDVLLDVRAGCGGVPAAGVEVAFQDVPLGGREDRLRGAAGAETDVTPESVIDGAVRRPVPVRGREWSRC